MARALFPAFLDLVGRRVLVVGGGGVAASKIPRLLEAGAHVVVVSPEVAPAIEREAVEVHRRAYETIDLRDAWYVVSAAPPEINARVVQDANARGVFVIKFRLE
jgi:uroporphyrin-III C-methyltransferase/precorrin-2 dehydrogenase/sirohydrochlorin ferrochelatase